MSMKMHRYNHREKIFQLVDKKEINVGDIILIDWSKHKRFNRDEISIEVVVFYDKEKDVMTSKNAYVSYYQNLIVNNVEVDMKDILAKRLDNEVNIVIE